MNYLRNIAIIVFLAVHSLSFAQVVVESADQMPRFAGCEEAGPSDKEQVACSNQNLVDFIKSQMKYPKSALDTKTEGMVLIEFVVDDQGNTTKAEIVSDIGNGCGQEALRVVNAMPKWSPAIDKGAPVNMKMRLPFRFNIPLANKSGQYASNGFRIFWGNLRTAEISLDELSSIGTSTPVVVRDLYGKTFNIDELTLTYERGKKIKVLKNEGRMSEAKMESFISNVKEGGRLTVETLIQKDTQFITVKRIYKIAS